mmetsp:Transcript_10685/g.19023  ORF Transcript_10685/g.19023 Transcript_10685/m.19023 type:complete len:129 (-) Transcript_10685:721-1107(-)
MFVLSVLLLQSSCSCYFLSPFYGSSGVPFGGLKFPCDDVTQKMQKYAAMQQKEHRVLKEQDDLASALWEVSQERRHRSKQQQEGQYCKQHSYQSIIASLLATQNVGCAKLCRWHNDTYCHKINASSMT